MFEIKELFGEIFLGAEKTDEYYGMLYSGDLIENVNKAIDKVKLTPSKLNALLNVSILLLKPNIAELATFNKVATINRSCSIIFNNLSKSFTPGIVLFLPF